MSNRIRRRSMENLILYDIDQLNSSPSPPALPPPREHRQQLPEQFAFERYRFLCDMQRHLTDPIYAATPMFTTILSTVQIKSPRRILGLRIPNEIIKARTPPASPSSSDSSQSSDTDNQSKDKSSDDDEDHNQNSDNDHEGGDQSSSSSSSSSNDDDDYADDDDDKGIVEQIFNRDRK